MSNKVKIGRKQGLIMECPQCQTQYARLTSQIGKTEQCGICLEQVVLVESSSTPTAPQKRRAKR